MKRFVLMIALLSMHACPWAQGRVIVGIPQLDASLGANAGAAAAVFAFQKSGANPLSLNGVQFSGLFSLGSLPLTTPQIIANPTVFSAADRARGVAVDGKQVSNKDGHTHGWTEAALEHLTEAGSRSDAIGKVFSGKGVFEGTALSLKADSAVVFDNAGIKSPDQAEYVEDLPPAGPIELTPERVEWLRAKLVNSPDPGFAEDGFWIFVKEDPKYVQLFLQALKTEQKYLSEDVVSAIYNSIRLVMESDLPAQERIGTAVALSRRYSGVLKVVQDDPEVPISVRKRAGRSLPLFRDNILVEEFVRAQQSSRELAALENTAKSILPPEQASNMPSVDGKWSVPEPIPESERFSIEGESIQGVHNTQLDFQSIKEYQFALERFMTRYSISIKRGGFSEKFIQRLYTELRSFLEQLFVRIPRYYARSSRVVVGSLPKSFILNNKSHSVYQVPDNKNLRLIAEPGGFLVTAYFETNIQDEAVLKMVKTSIEDYWKGDFDFQDKTYRFRVQVTFRVLAAGEEFSEGSLSLIDGKNVVSHVQGSSLWLGRDWNYSYPAHEFGHIMGLYDEYQEIYDADTRETEYILPTNLMGGGNPKAGILPRHLKTAYWLLRRHSLAN